MKHSVAYEKLMAIEREEGVSNLDDAIKKRNRKRLAVVMPEKRKRMSKRLKEELYARQGWKCARCHHWFYIYNLTDDHTVALAQGGTNSKWNRRLVCAECNSSKGSNDPIKESKLGHGTIVEQLGDEP